MGVPPAVMSHYKWAAAEERAAALGMNETESAVTSSRKSIPVLRRFQLQGRVLEVLTSFERIQSQHRFYARLAIGGVGTWDVVHPRARP